MLDVSVHKGLTTCKICNRVLSRINEMRKHMKAIHGYDEDEDFDAEEHLEGHQVEVQPVEDHAFENQEPYVEEAVEFEPINTD